MLPILLASLSLAVPPPRPMPPSMRRQPNTSPCLIFSNGFEAPSALLPPLSTAPIEYRTRGGYRVLVDRHTISVVDPIGMNTVQHLGDPHENLNGKHLKKWGGAPGWDGARRSLLLGDGSKLTMVATGPQGVVTQTSIYDGDENLQIDNATNTFTHHGCAAADTDARDCAQHDGETVLFATDLAIGTAIYINAYNDDAGFVRVSNGRLLGSSGGCANPNQANDLFDDPRLGNT